MTELSRLRVFKEVAEHRSFVKAGEILGVSKAAISKQISLLEDELSVRLLERTTRHVALTELGRIYLESVKPLLLGIEEAGQLVSQIHKKPSGRLRIAVARQFGETFVLPNLADFLNQYPDVRLDIELAERVPDIVREKIDILIGMSISGPPDCIQRTITKTRYLLCASPSYLKQCGTPKSPEELTNHRYIAHSMRKPDDEIVFSDKTRVHVVPYLRLNDSGAMLTAALNHLGIVHLHDYVVKEAIQKKRLVRLLSKLEIPDIPIYLCYQPQKFVLPKIRCFIDFITSRAKPN